MTLEVATTWPRFRTFLFIFPGWWCWWWQKDWGEGFSSRNLLKVKTLANNLHFIFSTSAKDDFKSCFFERSGFRKTRIALCYLGAPAVQLEEVWEESFFSKERISNSRFPFSTISIEIYKFPSLSVRVSKSELHYSTFPPCRILTNRVTQLGDLHRTPHSQSTSTRKRWNYLIFNLPNRKIIIAKFTINLTRKFAAAAAAENARLVPGLLAISDVGFPVFRDPAGGTSGGGGGHHRKTSKRSLDETHVLIVGGGCSIWFPNEVTKSGFFFVYFS